MGVVFLLGRLDEVLPKQGDDYRRAKRRLSSDSL